MSTRGDRIGVKVATALNSPPLDVTSGTLEEKKIRVWQAICHALELEFEPRWIEIYVNPTVGDGVVIPDGEPDAGDPYPVLTIAWQLNDIDATPPLPLAIWLKTGTALLAWQRLWPGGITLSTEIDRKSV